MGQENEVENERGELRENEVENERGELQVRRSRDRPRFTISTSAFPSFAHSAPVAFP